MGLDDSVRAHHQRGLATGDQGQHFGALLLFQAAGEPGDALAQGEQQRLQPADQLGEVLGGEDFGRHHQCALPPGVDADGGSQGGDHGFTGAHIAL